MEFYSVTARDEKNSAIKKLTEDFTYLKKEYICDAIFFKEKDSVVGIAGLDFYAPVTTYLLNESVIYDFCKTFDDSQLFLVKDNDLEFYVGKSQIQLPKKIKDIALSVIKKVVTSSGELDENGCLIIDLRSCVVGPHYAVNLLLGDRTKYDYPLFTTPKSAVDCLGRGSFRSGGAQQVLASRFVIYPEENGEPVNRQFYILEDGKQIFYSVDVDTNVVSAVCKHCQNYTIIEYETKCGLKIIRKIFLLPQEDKMPIAVESQYITIENKTEKLRNLKIVLTGAFGICTPETIVNDVVYANVVHQSELFYKDKKPVSLTLHNKNQALMGEKKFISLVVDGKAGFDDYCSSISEFLGGGDLKNPRSMAVLSSRPTIKSAPFFAIGKYFTLNPNSKTKITSLTGISEKPQIRDYKDVYNDFDIELSNLLNLFSVNNANEQMLNKVIDNYKNYISYLTIVTDDNKFDSYVNKNLPFQVLYQTFVSRSFAWTQKAYRETGFREIQDIFASLNYLIASDNAKLAKELISMWVSNIFKMGYAYHDFTWIGKDAGGCSDDQLWLVQAVYKYIVATGDYAFLDEEYSIAEENFETRSVLKTLIAILEYSGKISVGKHGLPLLDRADWNDTLRLDKIVFSGVEKEKLYYKQLTDNKQSYGVKWENNLTESVMNACLLKIAADEVYKLCKHLSRSKEADFALNISKDIKKSVIQNCWKDTYFARTLINDNREGGYTYLGAKGDCLSLDNESNGTYYLNSFSWSILSDIANENQISEMLEIVEKHLKVNAGLKLCTLVNYNLLGTNTATNLYYPGDRENGGVFKHAATMAVTAVFKAAKQVKDEKLAKRLVKLGEYAMLKVLPYKTLENPYIIKGNPRFCTQYNNSVTGENVGPILSGTASWLTLSINEMLGIEHDANVININPIALESLQNINYTIKLQYSTISVEIKKSGEDKFRITQSSQILIDGVKVEKASVEKDNKDHLVQIIL